MGTMSPARPVYTGSKTNFQSTKALGIGMTATLGVGAIATIVTCLVILKTPNTAAVSKVGKLLIDTDAGADDAVAILMALEAERMNDGIAVVGITCVNGNAEVDDVATNVLKTLKVLERLDIPVYKGAPQPLLVKDRKTDWFGKDGFGDFYYPDPPTSDYLQTTHAVTAMIDMVKKHPGEITLLAIGPLTNIALAIRMYPSFLDDLQQLIILGGSSEGVGSIQPGIEFNFSIDPAANYIVLNASTSKPAILVSAETAQRAKTNMAFRNSLSKMTNRKMWLIDSAESVSLDPKSEHWECADAVVTSVALSSGRIVTRSSMLYSFAIYEGSTTAGIILFDYKNNTKRAPNTMLIQDIDIEAYQNMLSTFLE